MPAFRALPPGFAAAPLVLGAYCSFYFYQFNQKYGVRQAPLLVSELLLGNVLLVYFTFTFTYGYLLPMHMPRRTGP